jgi:RNA polymerase sigma factor (sigma-70 family)
MRFGADRSERVFRWMTSPRRRPPDSAQPTQELEHSELAVRVYAVLDQLPEKYAEVLRMRDIEGHDAKEISDLTGVTHATVRWRLHQARKLFREIWEEKFGSYGDDHDEL